MTKGQIMEIFEKHMIPAVRLEIKTQLSTIEFRLRGLEKIHGIKKPVSIEDMYKNNEQYESEKHK